MDILLDYLFIYRTAEEMVSWEHVSIIIRDYHINLHISVLPGELEKIQLLNLK